jgi:hypothetical protein
MIKDTNHTSLEIKKNHNHIIKTAKHTSARLQKDLKF